MGLVDTILKKVFGDKAEKDLKEITPFVEKIRTECAVLENMSNDELRAQTASLKQIISDRIKADSDEIASLKAKIESGEIQLTEREKTYGQIDKLEKAITETIEEVLSEVLPKAFAIIKETARRFKENATIEVTASDRDRELAVVKDFVEVEGDKAIYKNTWNAGGSMVLWDMVHYDVQLVGGTALHQGKIAEMATGEGKTLVATLPVFLNALSGRGVHVVTVNDYLARRDSEWMGPLYMFHGLTVDCIDRHQPNSDDRRKAYMADITFGTNNEFGFDYLRDNMAISPDDLVQRPHNYAIVDEVDSVLIDDARTPLIISGPIPQGGGERQMFNELKPKVSQLVNVQLKLVQKLFNEAKKLIASEKKEDRELGAFLLLRVNKGLPRHKPLIKYLSETGIRTLLQKTEDVYLADNAKRMPEVYGEQPDQVGAKEYLDKVGVASAGLFFVIDEKQNSIDLTDRGIDLISTDTEDPKFFVLPDIGSTVAEIEKSEMDASLKLQEKEKVLSEYAIKSERVHTLNQLFRAYTLFEKDVEYVVMDNKVKIVDEQTGRIMEGRRYSDGLHQAIEAKESVKVEAATQTFATVTLQNYFRMYNKLAGMTGTAETEAGELWDIYKLDVMVIPTNRPIVRDDREDMVYKTKREKYNAVIEEVDKLTKAGRPVLVGTTSVEVSELLSRMLKIRKINHNVLNAKLHQREADIVAEAGRGGIVTIATNMAGRGTDIKLSKEVKDAGGLAIIGTERHESRRVDRQLRGRAGRQGDPGSSQFFVSLEDNLMRLFGSERISKWMDRMGLEDGEVIQHSMITKSIERAQKKVEENNFGIRKRLLEYDDVMNSQREVIYKRRHHALHGERLRVDILNMMYDVCESVVNGCHGQMDIHEFNLELIRTFSIDSPVSEQEYLKLSAEKVTERVNEKVVAHYKHKIENIARQAFPVIEQVYKNEGGSYENIVVPLTDGQRLFHIHVNLAKAYQTGGSEVVSSFEKSIMLLTIDEAWKEHLREMDDLKQSVQNASYEQKDPLLIYKFESFELFKHLVEKINRDVISLLLKASIPAQAPEQVREARPPKRMDMSKLTAQKSELQAPSAEELSSSGGGAEESAPQKVQTIKREQPKIGRNNTVKVRYADGRVLEGKYKKYEQDIEAGNCVLIK